MDFNIFSRPETWLSLLTLTFMEIVLGIDNIIFISLITHKLPEELRSRARTIGLSLALIFRIGLLIFIAKLVGLTDPLFTLHIKNLTQAAAEVSGRDIILFAGGIFLVIKSTTEIHGTLEGYEPPKKSSKGMVLQFAIFQIVVLDIVFSIDSILTAVGLVDHVIIMIAAVIISLIIMLIFSGMISDFIHKHPSLKMLALSFLLMIGFLLIVDACGIHVPKGYVYTSMFFSFFVELLNMRLRKKTKTVKLNEQYERDEDAGH